jgi:uncharacterized C2H2 Zn-finger protein
VTATATLLNSCNAAAAPTEGEGLDGLISVAEAFERSQQPDFNDIASPVVDGTDTERLLVKVCVLCGKALLGRNALGRHLKNAHPKVFGPYPCPAEGCPKQLESGSKLLAHMALHGGTAAGSSGGGQPARSLLACAQCDFSSTSALRLADHVKKVHSVASDSNDSQGGAATAAKSSTSSPSTAAPRLECNAEDAKCRETFATALQFIHHMRSEHGLAPWRCEVCAKRFQDRQNYRFHAMSHGDRKNFTCDICTKSYNNPRQLYAHRALHLGRRFLCTQCGYKARSTANLRGHIKNRHELQLLSCDTCSRTFKSGSNLRSHMRIHTGEKPFACELCEVRFKRSHHLNSHLESKGHLEAMERARRDGLRIPVRLDPMRRRRGRPVVEDGPVTLLAPTDFETEIETTTTTAAAATIATTKLSSSSSLAAQDVEDRSPSPLGQVCVFYLLVKNWVN